MSWVYLLLAILFEIVGTVSMKLSEGFTKILPSILMGLFYLLALASLALSLKSIPVSVAYAIWSGVGTAVIAVIGFLIFKEQLTPIKVFAILFIVIGVVMLNVSELSNEKQQGNSNDRLEDRT